MQGVHGQSVFYAQPGTGIVMVQTAVYANAAGAQEVDSYNERNGLWLGVHLPRSVGVPSATEGDVPMNTRTLPDTLSFTSPWATCSRRSSASLLSLASELGRTRFAPRARSGDETASFPLANYDDLRDAGLLKMCPSRTAARRRLPPT